MVVEEQVEMGTEARMEMVTRVTDQSSTCLAMAISSWARMSSARSMADTSLHHNSYRHLGLLGKAKNIYKTMICQPKLSCFVHLNFFTKPISKRTAWASCLPGVAALLGCGWGFRGALATAGGRGSRTASLDVEGRGKEEGKEREKERETRREKKEEKRRNLSVDLMAAAGLMRASRSALSFVTMPSSSLTTCNTWSSLAHFLSCKCEAHLPKLF